MVCYDRKYVVKKIISTWRKNNLLVVGVYEFTVVDKQVVKLYKQNNRANVIYLESPDKGYEGMIVVNDKEYTRLEKGAHFGECVVVRDKHSGNYYIVGTKYPDEAIREVTKESKLKILMIVIILTISVTSMVHIVKELFNL